MAEDARSTGRAQSRSFAPETTGQVVALGAFVWSLAFGLVSLYWAAGGTIGKSTLSASIRELAERRDPGFVATLWLTGVAKIAGGVLPVALAFDRWPRIPRRLLVLLCGLGGILLMLYGIGDMVRSLLILLDIGRSGARDDVRTAWWYLALWGPVWVIGGALYGATALMCRTERSS